MRQRGGEITVKPYRPPSPSRADRTLRSMTPKPTPVYVFPKPLNQSNSQGNEPSCRSRFTEVQVLGQPDIPFIGVYALQVEQPLISQSISFKRPESLVADETYFFGAFSEPASLVVRSIQVEWNLRRLAIEKVPMLDVGYRNPGHRPSLALVRNSRMSRESRVRIRPRTSPFFLFRRPPKVWSVGRD